MKLGIIGDIHAADHPPSSRTPSYREDVLAKLAFATSKLEAAGATTIIMVGDIFHIKAPNRVSHYLTNRIIDIISAITVEVIIQPGNHDLFGENEFAIERQPLATLSKLPRVKLALAGSQFQCGVSVTVTTLGGADVPADIALAHLPIVNGGWYPFPTIDARALDGQARAIVFGHMHDGPSVWKGKWTKFISPGALVRTSIKERGRQPCILLLDPATLDVDRIDVPVRPANEVFLEEVSAPTEETRDRLVSSFIGSDIIASGPEEVQRLLLANVPGHIKPLCEELAEEAFHG